MLTEKSKTVVALYDNKIQYVTLARNSDGFYVKKFDSAELESGVIKNGEILKADFLKKVLQKILKNIKTNTVDLILPHDYFVFDMVSIKKEGKKTNKKLVKEYLNKNKHTFSWADTHGYEYDSFDSDKKLKLLFRALPRDIYASYEYVFKKAGLKIHSIQSDLVSFAELMPRIGRITQIFFMNKCTYVADYNNGIYVSDKKFNLSRKQFLQDIIKNVKISDTESEKILTRYGILRTHRDPKVLARMERSMSPLLEFLTKRKIKEKSPIFIHFSDTPIRGFVDKIKRIIKTDVSLLCPMNTDKYSFQEVLTLHKKESYTYEPLIARALSLFDK